MKKLFKSGIFFLLIVTVFSLTAMSGSAAKVKKDTVDTVGAILAQEVFEMKVSGDRVNLVTGDTMHLNAEVENAKEQPEIIWSSSDETVATVDSNGNVTGVNVGRVLITATAEVAGQSVEGVYNINVITKDDFVKNYLEMNQILSYQYSYVDDYYYTDDKNCWQDTFGYARIYGLAAPYIALEYDYT